MSHSTPPLTPLTAQSGLSLPPILPHHIVGAAYALAPLDDLHLAHIVHSIKPPAPTWSFQPFGSDPASCPSIESNDRLRTDELADLSAPEAERLHAAYDIEDHLDSSPDRLLVFGPPTSLSDVLQEVRTVLETKAAKNISTHQAASGLQKPASAADPASTPRYNREAEVYVARLWVQPFEGPSGSYKWEKGGADLMRFELAQNQAEEGPILINWSPVEVALSQALEFGHQLLALLHLRQFDELLSTVSGLAGANFRPIDPIIWLVDPVEYAHAQLRETTEWGWSEHHVDRHHLAAPSALSSDRPHSRTRRSSKEMFNKLHKPLSRSQLSQEIWMTCETDLTTRSHPSHKAEQSVQPASKPALSTPDRLPDWLDELLDHRLPRVLALPDGCLSHELLRHPQPTSSFAHSLEPASTSSHAPSRTSATFDALLSPLDALHSPLNTLSSPSDLPQSFSSPLLLRSADMTRANSVHSTDLHYIPNPAGEQVHADGSPLKYYPCKACAEHAFKIALSHRLNEMGGKSSAGPRRKKVEGGGGSVREPIGLGIKGRAVKEAMDREDDEFLDKIGLCPDAKRPQPGFGPELGTGCCGKSGRLGWDEGEAVDDGEL
ncbi:hypothetical protein CROQUDRAFT_658629 [Cronartium quercuum f. sp. fusiforme G11]|uniref:Uncharacterized protein n=1 Tax=Cronartium quercuum f. sp. fusiforme G11 TaxID=708437 RepID=A0A9P6NEQ0_9BASI|nr:hypothetical protein CROQUDRAFT_658629 [Cronartium quercuum f. sp. fusiforme G11]